jgi:Uri superfamily endonuclease
MHTTSTVLQIFCNSRQFQSLCSLKHEHVRVQRHLKIPSAARTHINKLTDSVDIRLTSKLVAASLELI